MILKQIYLGCLSQASYLIGDQGSTEAAVVDPRRDVGEYLEEAERLGLHIRHVVLTHFHADFVSGHLELRERTGATIHLGARGTADFPFHPARDGDVLALGAVKLKFLETPGHTPESISILVYDPAKPGTPHAVLTGDTLFIGDVGRPDLMASKGVTALELAEHLYASTREKLLTLPDETLVYPGHGAGSMCGKNLSKDTVSTMGDQRRMNYALRPMSKEEFVRLVTADQPEAPAYFSYDADMNRRERETLDQQLERALRPLGLDAVLRLRDEGAQLLDVRDPTEFTFGHIEGSVNIGLGGQYASWAGTLLDRTKPIVILCSPGEEEEAAVRLGRIGFDHVAGFLEHGVEAALAERPDLSVQVERVTPADLRSSLASGRPPVVLDVRTSGERAQSRIPGSLHIPLNHLRERLSEVPRGRPLVVHCAGGYRSSMGLSILLHDGRTEVTDLMGGLAGWRQAGMPVEEGSAA